MAYYRSMVSICTPIHKLLYIILVLLGCAEANLWAVAQSKNTTYLKEKEARRKKWKDEEARFKKLMEANPDIIEDDFDKVFDFQTSKIDENELKEHLAQRKVWLAQHPDAKPIDFNGRGRFHSDEDLRKYVAERKAFLKKYPGSTDDDFEWLERKDWSEADLKKFFSDRATWLVKNPGKTSSDYQQVWQEAKNEAKKKARAVRVKEDKIIINRAKEQFKEIMKHNPILTQDDFYNVLKDYSYYEIDQDQVKSLVKRKKAEAQAKIKFNAMKTSNPEALDEDFDRIFDNETLSISEEDLKKRIAKRKAWLAQYKDATIDDFAFFENYPFVEKNKAALQKHLSGKADWIKQNPSKDMIRDYHFLWVRGQGFGKHPIKE